MGRCIPSPVSMLRMVLFVSLMALCAAGGGMKKYAQGKILESCMGEEYVQGLYKQMKDSSKKCSTQPQLFGIDDIDFQDVIDEVRNMALPWGSRQETANKYFKIAPSHGIRGKRHASSEPHKHTTAEKFYYMKDKMACMIGNMTCMLRDLDWMKEDKTPNIAIYEKDINNIPGASQGLKDELLWGLDVCKDFSMCLSPQRAKSPFMKELGTFISFSKCYNMKNIMACMKTDFKEYAAKDGYGDINELLDMGFGMAMGMAKKKKEKIGLNALESTMNGDLIF